MKRSALSCALSLALVWSLPAAAESFALVGATLHTAGPQGSIEQGVVVVEDGIITAVGAGLDVPDDVRRIDVAGKFVTPGLFDPHTALGLVEISGVSETVDAQQNGTRFAASFDIADAINPRSTLIAVNRIEGVTRAVVAPRPGNKGSVITGLGAVIHLGDTESYLLMRGAALYVQLGERGAKLAGGSRAEALLRLQEAFADAQDYADNRDAYEHRERRDYAVSRADLEALQPVLEGDVPVVVLLDRVSDIQAALHLVQRFDIRLIVVGGAEAWMMADELAAADVAVVLNAQANLPSSFENLNATLANAARLDAAGVTIAITDNGTHNPRNVTQSAGIAVANGLPWERALAAITINPAQIFGQEGVCGSLEPGKDADLVVWDGDPLEVTSYADLVFIRGAEIPMRSRQTLLRDRYMNLDDPLPPAYR